MADEGLTVCVVFRDGRVRDLVMHGPLPPRLRLPDPAVIFYPDGTRAAAAADTSVQAREFQLQIAHWEDDTIRDYFYVEVS